MQNILYKGALLAGALVFTLNMTAQQSPLPQPRITETNAAVGFNFERAQVAETGTPGFWLKGGAADVSVTFWNGLGIATNLTGEHASNIHNNVSLGKVSYMGGPRYTLQNWSYTDRMMKNHATEVFAEWLFGGVHAFDSIFPSGNDAHPTANGFSMQMGGGLDLAVAKGFGFRAFEIDWLHTSLPNNSAGTQNDFRVAFGVCYRR